MACVSRFGRPGFGASGRDRFILAWEATRMLNQGAAGCLEALCVHFWPCWLLLLACLMSSYVLGVGASARDHFLLVRDASGGAKWAKVCMSEYA